MNNDDKNHNIYDSGFDQHLNRKGVVEEADRQFQSRIKEERDEKERRERLRIQRVASSGKNPLLYSLDVIIEKCLLNTKSNSIEIDFHSLGFPDGMQEVISAHHFFDQLKDAGCFKGVERSANTYFIVTAPNITKLQDYRASLEAKIGKTKQEAVKRLLDKDSYGNFLYNGKPIKMKKGTLHYDLLDILFSDADQHGFLPYENIEKLLVDRGHPEKENPDKRDKRIRNTLTNQLFRIAKVNGKSLENKTLKNRELIELSRGEGLQLNNDIL